VKKNKVMVGLGVVLLILVVLTWRVFVNLEGFVANAIEDAGSEALKTDVSVSGVKINLSEGIAAIGGLTVANPDGYSNGNLFELEGIEVNLDLDSIGKEVLVITSIRIQNPKIIFEGDAAGGSNMQTLIENMESGSEGGEGSNNSGAGESAPPLMIIDKFEISGADVHATSELKPGKVMNLKLPAINMKGIGRSEGGVTAEVVGKEVTSELAGAVISAAAKAGLEKAIEKKTKRFLDKLKGKG
jgi:hypothetical protein